MCVGVCACRQCMSVKVARCTFCVTLFSCVCIQYVCAHEYMCVRVRAGGVVRESDADSEVTLGLPVFLLSMKGMT